MAKSPPRRGLLSLQQDDLEAMGLPPPVLFLSSGLRSSRNAHRNHPMKRRGKRGRIMIAFVGLPWEAVGRLPLETIAPHATVV